MSYTYVPQGSDQLKTVKVGMIWAQNQDGIIGDGKEMPWHLPLDLKHFKEVTQGSSVIMGRKTWDSLNPRFRPLPGRTNIVITRDTEFSAPGAVVAHSLEDAYESVEGDTVWVIGGGNVYAQALDNADYAEVTEIQVELPTHYDVHAPNLRLIPGNEWKETKDTNWSVDPDSSGPDEQKDLLLRFVTWEHTG